ncbi:lymphocyte cytosolic protein 2 [Polymixia lowei]
MSFDGVPPKMEVMGWNSFALADFMKRLKLSGCEKVVKKGNITGMQFLQMTECELQKFPSIHVPIITKIINEINRSEEKKSFGQRFKAPKCPKQNFTQEGEVWDSDEFDKESDDDYEHPSCEGDETYICALADSPEDWHNECEEGTDDDYEEPPSADTEGLPRHLNLATPLGDSGYIGAHHVHSSQVFKERPQAASTPMSSHAHLAQPRPPRMDRSPQRPCKAPGNSPAGPAIPQVDRRKKPGQSGPPKRDLPNSREGSTCNSPTWSETKLPQVKGPKPPDHFNRASKVSLAPEPTLKPDMAGQLGQTWGMDPRWYGRQVNRYQAEAVLREVNKDGAFMVRDSSKGSSEQPYTLMVLNQDKVYNIQIRNQGNSYFLGTGLKNNERFTGVKEMISHFTHTPLLLIDAMDRSPGVQCTLQHPTGF